MIDTDLISRVCRYAASVSAPEAPYETGIAGFSFIRSHHETMIEAVVYKPLLCLVLQGAKESYLGGRKVKFSKGDSLIVSLDLPSLSRITDASAERPYVALALELDIEIIRELSAQLKEMPEPSECAAAMIADAADPVLADAMSRMFDLVEKPKDQKILLPLLMREIHYRLLQAGHGEMIRRLARQDSRASRISRAIANIRANYTQGLNIQELAREVGMSSSSFHEHFKAITATTPLQYQKDLRLIEARNRLQAGSNTVTTVAFEMGYESPTQFSREYTRKFGSSPRKDLQLFL